MNEEVAIWHRNGSSLAVVGAGDSQAIIKDQQHPVQLHGLRIVIVHHKLFYQVLQEFPIRPNDNLWPRQTTRNLG